MRYAGALLILIWLAAPAAGQQVVDRILVHIEDDIITQSEAEELSRFQQLVQGQAASEKELTDELIEQWIVRNEATTAAFPAPSDAAVNAALERLEKQFPSETAFRARLDELDLNEAAVRRLLRRQILLTRYLANKFRPLVQVTYAQVKQYYEKQLTPELKARGEAVPALEKVDDQIRELLTQDEMNKRAAAWLDEAKSRLKIVMVPEGNAP